MNDKRFETWMSAADEELLEEAQMPLPTAAFMARALERSESNRASN